jgi:hypothetical protein
MNDVTGDFDYRAEALKTLSPLFNPENVKYDDFLRCLKQFVELGNVLNIYKRLIYRGKTPDELNMPTPAEHESLVGFIAGWDSELAYAILGGATETAEAVEILVGMLEGIAPDRVNVIEEVGDQKWYHQVVLRWADCSDEQCERANIAKLRGRLGEAFDAFRDDTRDKVREYRGLADDTRVHRDAEPLLPLGPHGDEEDDGLITVHPSFERRPIGGCEGMDC